MENCASLLGSEGRSDTREGAEVTESEEWPQAKYLSPDGIMESWEDLVHAVDEAPQGEANRLKQTDTGEIVTETETGANKWMGYPRPQAKPQQSGLRSALEKVLNQ